MAKSNLTRNAQIVEVGVPLPIKRKQSDPKRSAEAKRTTRARAQVRALKYGGTR